MSLSPEERKADGEALIRAAMEELGDGFYRELDIDPAHQDWRHFHRTTWADLADDSLLTRENLSGGARLYQLTESGWLEGLRIAGIAGTPEFEDRRQRLLAALKHLLGAREDDVVVNYREIATASALPETWILNAVTSNMLYFRSDYTRNYYLTIDDAFDVVIPVNFGLEDLR